MTDSTQSDSPPRRGIVTRFFRWLFSWRSVRAALFVALVLVTLFALAGAIENWRGKRAWMKYRTEKIAQGEPMEVAAIIPPLVRDEENFAMTPLFKSFFDYRYGTNGIIWADTNAQPRLQRIRTDAPQKQFANGRGSWVEATRFDLKAWQEYYRSTNLFPISAAPQTPAADVLLALTKFDPELNELHEAARLRTKARFPVHYEELFEALLPHLAHLKQLSLVLQLRSAAYLANGETEKAKADIELAWRLGDSVRDSQIISMLVRIAVHSIALEPLWEGLADHRWSDEQLASFQQWLEQFDFIDNYFKAIRVERAVGNSSVEKWIADPAALRRDVDAFASSVGLTGESRAIPAAGVFIALPRGWLYQNLVSINRFYDKMLAQEQVISPTSAAPALLDDAQMLSECSSFTMYKILARMLAPAVGRGISKAYRAQSAVTLAHTACALERYRLANGQFPDKLDALVPRFAKSSPVDLMTGQPLKYHRTDNGSFVLYSVGIDRVDDNGVTKVGKRPASAAEVERGDWVWRYPAK
ncbi:MAG: hypothetical protein HY043_24140 [Verrucomicrobia bacterium]|nr:hypothetical protein [Verrucomicrobiota bacterium]